MLTTWIPLAEVPVALGGLAVRPGGHQDRPRRPRLLAGTEPGWATTCYRPGDVIIFHCLTPHAALPNTRASPLIPGHRRSRTSSGIPRPSFDELPDRRQHPDHPGLTRGAVCMNPGCG